MFTVEPIEFDVETEAELRRRANGHTSPLRVARRARIVLSSAQGCRCGASPIRWGSMSIR